MRLAVVIAADSPDRDVRDRTDAFESMATGRGIAVNTLRSVCMYDRRRYSADYLAQRAHPCVIA